MPTTDRKLRVFLCHSSQDKPIVRELYQRLNAEGWIDPWLDEEKLLPGQDWDMEIEKAVEATDAVIVCLSNNSVSKEGYVQRELRSALEIALEKPEETIFIIPLRLDNCDPPRRLRVWHYADYFPEEVREKVYGLLSESLRSRANKLGVLESNKAPRDDTHVQSPSNDLSALQEFRLRAGDFYSKSLRLRKIAAIEIERISADLSLNVILSFVSSIIPGERVACGIALREKVKSDPTIGETSEIKKVVMALLNDRESLVRYRALEIIIHGQGLFNHFEELVEVMATSDRNASVKSFADALLHG